MSFIIQAKRETLPAVLALLGEMLREPTFPAEEFDILKREYARRAWKKGWPSRRTWPIRDPAAAAEPVSHGRRALRADHRGVDRAPGAR